MFKFVSSISQAKASRTVTAWRRDDSGATAIEFAIVSLPFLMLLFGIIAVGLFFFTTFATENAIEQASRPFRTGAAQTAGKTKEQFKQDVCNQLPAYVNCDSKLRINVQRFAAGDPIAAPSCVEAGALVAPAGTPYVPGARNDIMLVTACLEWELAAHIPFLKVGKMANGSALIQASTTFKTEPY